MSKRVYEAEGDPYHMGEEEEGELPIECQSWALAQHAFYRPSLAWGSPMIFCGLEGTRLGTKDHSKIRVSYSLWPDVPHASLCWHRVRDWITEGRFVDSRAWIKRYVVLLVGIPALEPLRGVFRLYARSLIWPAYQILPPWEGLSKMEAHELLKLIHQVSAPKRVQRSLA